MGIKSYFWESGSARPWGGRLSRRRGWLWRISSPTAFTPARASRSAPGSQAGAVLVGKPRGTAPAPSKAGKAARV